VRERIAANLACLESSIAAADGEIELLPADGGWFGVLRLAPPLDSEAWALRLLEHDVVVHPGDFYDFADGSFAVVSLIVEPARFARGIERMAEWAGTSGAHA
jgi:DNA-binding transcriptional MocR family regulator